MMMVLMAVAMMALGFVGGMMFNGRMAAMGDMHMGDGSMPQDAMSGMFDSTMMMQETHDLKRESQRGVPMNHNQGNGEMRGSSVKPDREEHDQSSIENEASDEHSTTTHPPGQRPGTACGPATRDEPIRVPALEPTRLWRA
jgi:hypothetical protein